MMRNKILLATSIFIGSSLLSSVAFADSNGGLGDGFFASGNAGSGSSTYCQPGFYVGVQGGRSDTFYSPADFNGSIASNFNNYQNVLLEESFSVGQGILANHSVLSSQSVDDTGFGGRLYVGYQFNPYIALETGYTQFADTKYKATGTVDEAETISINNVATVTSTVPYEATVKENAIDLVAKGTLPLQDGFGLYAKAGIAYVQAKQTIKAGTAQATANELNTTVNFVGQPETTIKDKNYHAFRPVYGVGVDYTIPNTNIDTEVFFQEIVGNNTIPHATLWGLGIGYKFA